MLWFCFVGYVLGLLQSPRIDSKGFKAFLEYYVMKQKKTCYRASCNRPKVKP